MAELSILEFLVYGIICYTGMILLMIGIIKETPTTKSQSLIRAMFLIPPMVCAAILAGAAQTITTETISYQDLHPLNGTAMTLTETHTVKLLDPVWVLVHYMFFIIMLVTIITNMLMALTRKD